MTGLVLGFGPFLEVLDNPARRLALAVDGLVRGPLVLVGREMPVSYARCLAFTHAAITEHRPSFVLGIGVARSRTEVLVERLARQQVGDTLDVDGCRTCLDGPDTLEASLDVARLASALGVGISDDCGDYVCNGWLYGVLAQPTVPAAFLHVPDDRLPAETLADALQQLVMPTAPLQG